MSNLRDEFHDAGCVYERYYELVKQAMLAQVDRQAETGLLGLGHEQIIVRAMQREFHAVISCWRSASQVPPPDDYWAAGR